MAGPIITTSGDEPAERRRIERRGNSRLGDLTLPEVRRILITLLLGTLVLALFFWMVKSVVVAAILGLIIGFYIRPLHLWLLARTGRRNLSAILTLLAVIVPVLLVLAYSYSEMADVVGYAAMHQAEIVKKVDAAVQRIPMFKDARFSTALGGFVISLTAYGARVPGLLRAAVKDFAIRAKDKKLKPDEFDGGTITVSNLGAWGIESFDAIVNPPQAVILSVGAAIEKPVVKNGQIVPGLRMNLGISCDHRVVDGAVGAQFLAEIKKLIEQPALMLF